MQDPKDQVAAIPASLNHIDEDKVSRRYPWINLAWYSSVSCTAHHSVGFVILQEVDLQVKIHWDLSCSPEVNWSILVCREEKAGRYVYLEGTEVQPSLSLLNTQLVCLKV